MKFNASLLAIFSVIVVASLTGGVTGMPPVQCNPGFFEEVPPRIRKICMALSTLYELGSAMESYIDDKVMQQNLPLPDSGVKRQDVDHVFLRFGRRR